MSVHRMSYLSRREVYSQGWGLFLNCLKNKALEYGKTLHEVSSFVASTQKCSNCGLKKEMTLRQREYIRECGHILDRDLNADKKKMAVGASV